MLRVLPFFMNRHDAALAHVSNGAKWRIVVGVWNVNRRMLLGKDQATSQQVLTEVTPNQCLQSHVSAFRARRARGLADSMICIVHFSLRGIPLW